MFKKIFFSFCVIWTFAGIACVQAYEPEFVAFVDQHRPRLIDNPATISQLDEDYFEIEPPRPPSYDSDVNIQRFITRTREPFPTRLNMKNQPQQV